MCLHFLILKIELILVPSTLKVVKVILVDVSKVLRIQPGHTSAL